MKAILVLLICIAFITPALADNCTNDTCALNLTNTTYTPQQTQDQLQQFSQQAKSFNETIKSTVPYELWEFATLGLAIVVVFTKGANQGYSSLWKIGLYVGAIAAVLWFLVTR